MRRGASVTVALQGEQGKPRPALVIQADSFANLPALTVLPITGTLTDALLVRVLIEPTPANELAKRPQVMVDKSPIPLLARVGPVFGHLDNGAMLAVNRAPAVFLGPA